MHDLACFVKHFFCAVAGLSQDFFRAMAGRAQDAVMAPVVPAMSSVPVLKRGFRRHAVADSRSRHSRAVYNA